MMESMESERSSSTRHRTSLHYREEGMAGTFMDVDEGDLYNVELPEDHEIESTQATVLSYSRRKVCMVIGLTIVLVLGIFTIASTSSNGKVKEDRGSFTAVDDSPSQGSIGNGFVPVQDSTMPPVKEHHKKVTVSPTAAPVTTTAPVHHVKATIAPSMAPVTPAPVHKVTATLAPTRDIPTSPQPTQPMHQHQGCLMAALDNEHMKTHNRIYPGQYLCSSDGRFRFGMDSHANVVYRDMDQSSVTVFFKNPINNAKKQGTLSPDDLKKTFYLQLKANGHLVLHHVETNEEGNEDTIFWTATPRETITLKKRCKPDHDCPYLEMEEDGVLVANWESLHDNDNDGVYDWMEKSFTALYGY